jgi:hypothetical protein
MTKEKRMGEQILTYKGQFGDTFYKLDAERLLFGEPTGKHIPIEIHEEIKEPYGKILKYPYKVTTINKGEQ